MTVRPCLQEREPTWSSNNDNWNGWQDALPTSSLLCHEFMKASHAWLLEGNFRQVWLGSAVERPA